MSVRTSSAALHAARVLFRHYRFTVRPAEQVPVNRYDRLQATDIHVAILIDGITNVSGIALLRPKITYWQQIMDTGVNDAHTASQITYFVHELIEALERVPRFPEEEKPPEVSISCPITVGAWTVKMKLTRAALDSMQTLYYYYDIQPIKAPAIPNEAVDRIHVAKLIDCCLNVGKALRALPMLRRGHAQLLRGQASAEDLIACLERIRFLFEFLPNYQDHRDEVKLLA
jgi:hypothetical protein